MLSSDGPTLDDYPADAKPRNSCNGEWVALVVLACVELAGIGLLLTGQAETAGVILATFTPALVAQIRTVFAKHPSDGRPPAAR